MVTARSAIPTDYETPNCFMTVGHDERFPVQAIRESDYERLIFWGSELEDPANDNLDIDVRTLDGRFSASVFVLRNVVSLLDKHRAMGETPTAYFGCPEAVVVNESLTEELLRTLMTDAKGARISSPKT